MNFRFPFLLILFLSLFWIPSTGAVPMDEKEAEEVFRQANALFRQANELAGRDAATAHDLYERAAMNLERLVGEGGIRNGKLFYNLGNAYFRLGDMGRAILNYRRAQLLIPGDRNLRQNLEYVRGRRADKIEEPEPQKILRTLFFFHYDIPLVWKRGIFAVGFLLFWVAAVLLLFMRRPFLKWVLCVSGLLASLFLGSLLVDQVSITTDRSGVILSSEVIARKGDGETFQPAFKEPLHSGTEFSLLEERPGWLKIRLSDGRECWLPEGAAALVRPG